MPNRALHDALRDFAIEAAALLTADVDGGAEVGFEVDAEAGRGPVLYRYRALTAEFIAERWPRLRELPSFEPAAQALGSGATAYLRVRGHAGADAEPALQAMLERLYDEATDLSFPEDRFERTYAEVERVLFHDSHAVDVIVPVVGLVLGSDRVELGDGLALVTGGSVDAPREAVWPEDGSQAPHGHGPLALALLESAVGSGEPLPFAEAAERFRALLSAMRLFKSGGLALGGVGWARADEGPWQPAPLGSTGFARGAPWTLATGEEGELRDFLAVHARTRLAGAAAWAAVRFELGVERALDTEALSDYLLALRALLDGGDEIGRASLSLRLAALCAGEGERRAVARRVEAAFALERFVIGGGTDDGYLRSIGCESPAALVLEIEEHLRALLRDVLCGYLDPNLKTAADDILLASGEPLEIRARDLRVRPDSDASAEPEPRADPEMPAVPEAPPAPVEPDGGGAPTERRFRLRRPDPPAAEREDDGLGPAAAAAAPLDDESDPGVTASPDWSGQPIEVPASQDWDFDDPDDYSAPV